MNKSNIEYEKIMRDKVDLLVDYVLKDKLKSLVLGISGGIDSAVVATIAYEASQRLKRMNKDIKLVGRFLAIDGNEQDEIRRAELVGDSFFKDDFQVQHHLDCIFRCGYLKYDKKKNDYGNDNIKDKIYFGNIKARLRMSELYSRAYEYDGMVLGTDNLTEYNLGFFTKHGDVGDYEAIHSLWKMEVYELATYLIHKYEDEHSYNLAHALFRCYEAVPTDGLGITESDYEQFGVDSYDEVDRILRRWLYLNKRIVELNLTPSNSISSSEILKSEEYAQLKESPIVKRNMKSEYKRRDPLKMEI